MGVRKLLVSIQTNLLTHVGSDEPKYVVNFGMALRCVTVNVFCMSVVVNIKG